MTDELNHYFRIDYRSKQRNGYVGKPQRIHVHDVERWEDLISSIMDGSARHPDTNEVVVFDSIVRIEKVNRGTQL